MACATGFAQPLRARVEAADDALQFSKFFHQLGGEIGLGQQHRLFERCMVKRNSLGGDCGPQSFGHEQVAFGLAEVAAKIPLKGNRLELFQPLLQRESSGRSSKRSGHR